MRRWLIVLVLLLLPGWVHGNPCGSDTPPTAAVTYGLTCETFVDNFTSLSTIDVNNTGNPGYKWYTNISWDNGDRPYGVGPTPSTDYSITGSGLVLSPVSSAPYSTELYGAQNYGNAMLNTCGYSTNAAGYVGKAFAPPYYVVIKATISGSWDSVRPWPSLWMSPIQYFVAGNSQNLIYTEFDVFETPYGVSLHQWTIDQGSTDNSFTTKTLYVNGGDLPFGALVVPSTVNGGTGIAASYHNNSLLGSTTWTAGQTYSTLDTDVQCIMLSAGVGNPMTVTSVQVWQAQPYLLRRDLDPASNDNSPAFMDKAA